jgi:MFS family permease
LLPLDLFREQIFTAASVASFFVGPLLLGLGVYLPLFVQGVLQQSATNSGAIITPLTVGSVVTNVLGGQYISRTGHYQRVALVGLAICTVGVLLLLGMGINTDNVTLVRNMVITGLGLGFVLPVYTIAVQNALPYSRLGVVTSSVQFTRSIGSTIGIAVLGSIVSSVYATQFTKVQTPSLARVLDAAAAQGHAVPSNPEVLVSPEAQAAIRAGLVQFLGPQQGTALYQQFVHAVQLALLDAVHASFFGFLLMALAAFVATLFLKEIPLRRSYSAQGGAPAGAPQEQPPVAALE